MLNLTHFHDDIVELFIKSDIPLHKLTSPHFVKFLSNYNLPSVSQSTAHRRIKKIADNKLNKIKTKLINQNIFIVADDTTIHKKYYTNILIGDLQNPKKNTWLNAMYQKPIIIQSTCFISFKKSYSIFKFLLHISIFSYRMQRHIWLLVANYFQTSILTFGTYIVLFTSSIIVVLRSKTCRLQQMNWSLLWKI